MNDEDKWFKPVLELEGGHSRATLQANIALIKEKLEEEDEDDDDDLE